MKDFWNNVSANVKKVSNFVHEEFLSRPPFNIQVQDERLRVAVCAVGLVVAPAALPMIAALAVRDPVSPERSLELLELEGETIESIKAEANLFFPPAPAPKSGPNVYRMSGMPRGQCIIINNKVFEDTYNARLGSEIDVARMQELFRSLHFDVCIGSNLTAERMKQTLDKVARAQCERTDCLVVIMMSHGKFDKIVGVDGDYIDLMEDVYSLFNNENCPALQGKPKVFFIQACRGTNEDSGCPAVGGSTDTDSNVQKSPGKPPICPVSEGSKRRMPSFTHMLVADATIPRDVAHRSPEEGSWFISSVYEVFRSKAYSTPLQDMMRDVEKQVNEKTSPDGSRQTASTTTYGWTKQLYFNIGHFR